MAFADPPTPQLRESGWTLPAYTMAPDCGHVKLLRAVIREDMSLSLAARLIADILRALDYLDHHFMFTPEQLQEYGEAMMSKGHFIDAPDKEKFNGVC